jgi:predicted AlkP superfamily pyrophosphatase or phosphodiesterase
LALSICALLSAASVFSAAPRPLSPGSAGKPTAPAPKLVLLVVADQFRADNLSRMGHLFVDGGLRKITEKGAFAIGRYGQQNTYTGPGHALIATGSYGYINGITQNKFWNRQSGKAESMLYDGKASVIGESELTPEDDSSPRNLLGTTMFDELKLAQRNARVVTVALKARGAILLGGHLGSAYFFSDQTGEMTTSTYYTKELPDWVKRWNARKVANASFNTKWERLLPAENYPNPDDSPGEADLKGLGRVFPHPLTGKLSAPGPGYYEALTVTPVGLDIEMDFARAAIEGEQLGKRDATDVLAISISGTDLAGHLYGPYSHEYQDMVLRFDRAIASLLGDLEKRFKPGELMVLFTADHGASPIPDELGQRGILANRLKKPIIKEKITKALTDRFNVSGEWVIAMEDPSIYLSQKLIAQTKADPGLVEEVAGQALLELQGVIGYFTRTQLQHGWVPPTDVGVSVTRSYFPARGGEVVMVTAPFHYWSKYGDKELGTSHGSFYRYDTEVPMAFYGPWFVPGEYGVIDMVDFAATVSHALRLTPPAACAGRPVSPLLRSSAR